MPYREGSDELQTIESAELAAITAEAETSIGGLSENQDTYALIPDGAVICDGVGGQQGGKKAALVACTSLIGDTGLNQLLKSRPQNYDAQVRHSISSGFREANREVVRSNETENTPNGLTTAVLVKVIEVASATGKQRKAYIGHVGDSRVRLFRNGRLTIKTVDSSTELLKQGWDRETNLLALEALSEEKDPTNVEGHKVLSAIGRKSNVIGTHLGSDESLKFYEPEITCIDLEEGDLLLLETDGVRSLTTPEMEEIIKKYSQNPKKAVQELIAAADKADKMKNNPRSNMDNKTAVIINPFGKK